jgi:hypothetical protein
MTTKTSSAAKLALGAMAATGLLVCAGQSAATTPSACVGAGVVTRIVGDPQTLSIARGATRVTRPRVLEVVCVGDRVSVTGATRVTLSLDGRGAVTVSAAAPYAVAARAGAPTLAGNAYRAVNDQVMPDMKRMPWNVRLRADEPFAFALGNLPAGNQRLAPGTRPLLVRVMGGRGPYRITLANATGQTVAEASGGDGNLHLPAANLTSGRYHLTARDSGGGAVEADITVATRPEAEPDTYQAISDPEVRAAATAAAIARQRAATSALEAEQLLAAAPMNGLDRGAVYDLIESYGAE